MHILVTALSLYKTDLEAEYFLTKEGRTYHVTGRHTNEPVAKALQLYLERSKQKLDKIVLLCTPATNQPDDSGKSSVDKFQAAMAEAGICPEYHCLTLEEMPDSQSIYNTSKSLLNLLQNCPEPSVYIDSTGGFRDAMMFLISMMQLLKEENIHIADVFYTLLDRKSAGPHPIISRMDAYQVYDLISGYEDLNTYGDPRKLKEYYRGRNISQDAQKILDALKNVYQELQLCRVAQGNAALLQLSQRLEAYTPSGSSFDRVVELAKAKYGGIREGFTALEFIRWYHDHGYVAQSLAFLYEVLPDLLVDGHIIYFSQELKPKLREDYRDHVLKRNENYPFLNFYFKDTFFDFTKRVEAAQKELRILSSSDQISAKDLRDYLSPTGQLLYNGLNQIKMSKLNTKMLTYPEAAKLVQFFQENGATGLRSVQNLQQTDIRSIYDKIASNKKLLCALYGITWEERILTDKEHGKLIVNSVDGKNTFLGEGVNRERLAALLEKYFYLKEQRNSVFHVKQDIASYKTLVSNIAEALALMEEVL